MDMSELFDNYPESAPQNPLSLIYATPEELRSLEELSKEQLQTVLNFRKVLITAANSGALLPPIASADMAKTYLQNRHLLTVGRAWTIYPLDNLRRRIMDSRNGYVSVVKYAAKYFPSVGTLQKENIRPTKNGTFIALYGGSPTVLEHEVLRKAINKFQSEAPLADVLFWQLEKGEAPILWSMRAGFGEGAPGTKFSFQDPNWLEECGFTQKGNVTDE